MAGHRGKCREPHEDVSEVTIQTVESSREFEDNYVDLSKVINMEIDEEE